MKRKLCVLFLAIAGMVLTSGCGAQKQASQDFYAMDTVMNITAYGKDADAAVVECVQYINDLEANISRNRADGETTVLSEQTADILSDALTIADRTGGAFDPTVAPLSDLWKIGTEEARIPKKKEIREALETVGYQHVLQDGTSVAMQAGTRIDLGGIGKGYAADHVVEILRKHGVERALVSLGGNIYAVGSKEKGLNWTIAITDPDDEQAYLGTLSVSDTSVVTSGDYERYFEQDGKRYCHIFDSTTGYPAETDLRSVTVVSPNSTEADGYTTALFVMGHDKAVEFCEKNGIQAVLVCDDHTIYVTDDLKDAFHLESTEYRNEE